MIVPTDLNDKVALRNFLQKLADGQGAVGTNGGTGSSSSSISNDGSLSQSISDYIKAQVAAFKTSFDKVYATFDYNFKALYGITIEEKVANQLKFDGVTTTTDQLSSSIAAANTQITTNMSTLTTNYATTAIISSTYATQSQVGALYEVAVEANGHVSGYKSVATGTSSIFKIYAEKFAISSSATTEGYQPFQIDTVNHKINMTSNVAIDGNLLVAGTVQGDKIVANTINGNRIIAGTLSANSISSGVIYNTGGNSNGYVMKIDLDNGEIHIV